MTKVRLVLASASPRRALLLSTAGFSFDIRPSNAPEEIPEGEPPGETVLRLSHLKAEAVDRSDHEVVLAADTLVVLGGQALGKPADRSDAIRMLSTLSGVAHSVLTGWAIISDEGERFGVSESRVAFRELTADDIAAYVDDTEPFDMAGAYGIQGEKGRLIEQVTGSRANVMGLPLRDVVRALADLGIDARQRPA